ncbi:hypothetical protein MY3296_008329 [Beauveria thailandica]
MAASTSEKIPDGDVSPPAETEQYSSGMRLAMIVVALVLTIFLVALDMTIVATAIPRITDEFQSLDQVGWYGSAFFLTLATFQATWGKLYKYTNLKLAFLTAGLIFEVGSLICGVAPNSTALIIGRAIAGWGAAGLVGGCYTLIAFVAPPHKAPAYTGLVGTSYGTASVIGPLLGGVFTDKASWRWCFYVNLPIGAVAFAIIAIFFQVPGRAKPVPATLKEKVAQLDLPGAALIIGALVCFLINMQIAGTSMTWDSSEVIGMFVGFGLFVFCFIGVQVWQGERASIVPRILKTKIIAGICAFVFFQSGANFLFTYYIPIYFQAIHGMSAADSGVRNIPFIALSLAFFAALSGLAITRLGYFTPFIAIGSAIFTTGAGLIYTLGIGSSAGYYLGYQVILGLGQGLAIQIPVITGQAFSAPEDIAATTAIVLFFQMMGGTVFVSGAQAVFANRLVQTMGSHAIGVAPEKVLSIGASELRKEFSGETLAHVLESYMVGIEDTFLFGTVVAACAFLASWIAPIKSIAKRAPEASTAEVAP